MPDKCVAFINGIIIPVSWYNIDEDNKYIYVRRLQYLTNTKTNRILPTEVSNHTTDTLNDAVQEAINRAFSTGVFSVSYVERQLKLSITAEAQSELKSFTDEELKGVSDWSGPAYDSNNLMSANDLLSNYTAQFLTAPIFKSGIVDLRRFHNVYITSPDLSSFKPLGPRGESNSIKQVPVTTESGFAIFDQCCC